MSDAQGFRRLGPPAVTVQIAWLLPALISGPGLVFIGLEALYYMYHDPNHNFCPLWKTLALVLICDIVLYTILNAYDRPHRVLRVATKFELARAILAAFGWLWLGFYPGICTLEPSCCVDPRWNIIFSGVSGMFLSYVHPLGLTSRIVLADLKE